ncbi:hypothetical protein JW890_08970 [candidate division WOR-3 bacterium]|nr:hypothetical protein [candidate division WOR-3 bacterium]
MPALISCTSVIAILLLIIGFLFIFFSLSQGIKRNSSSGEKKKDLANEIYKSFDKKAEEGKFEDIEKDKNKEG